MEHVETQTMANETLIKVWSVDDFCDRHRIENTDRVRLLSLFGSYATAHELLYNARLKAKFR